jgi:membrane-associated phospholipid phosphatase
MISLASWWWPKRPTRIPRAWTADRPRPYEVMADAVLRQQPAHGTSFPSSHTAVTLAVVIALVPFLARPLAAAGIAYAVLVGWSRVYLGCTIRWTSWAAPASA